MEHEAKLRITAFLIPFLFLFGANLSVCAILSRVMQMKMFLLFTVDQLAFITALSLTFGNIILEAFFSGIEDKKNSSIYGILYGGKPYIPVHTLAFIGVFVLCQAFLSYKFPYFTSFKLLILIIPPVAILLNAPLLISKRVRFVDGSYICWHGGGIDRIILYYMDDLGGLVFLADNGKLIKTDINQSSKSLKTLEAEFEKNGLHHGNDIPI